MKDKKLDWQDAVIIGSIIGGTIIIGLIFIIKSQSQQSQLSVPNNNQAQKLNQTNSNSTDQNEQKTLVLIPSPEESIKQQYSLINNRQYQEAWNHLSANFRNNQSIFPNGFNSYVNWWDTVNYSEVQNVNLISQDDQRAIANVKLKFTMKKGQVVHENRQLKLIWDNDDKIWLIDQTKKVN